MGSGRSIYPGSAFHLGNLSCAGSPAWPTRYGNDELVRYLLSRGADANLAGAN